MDLSRVDLWIVVAGFAACVVVIVLAGTKLAAYADRLADRTGLGEAMIGAVLLGGSTSLPGIVTSIVAAGQGHPELSIGNAVGGIAVQTAFLGIADLSYRKANLEHAAASASNLTQCALLIGLLAIPLVAMSSPEVTVLGVHPGTPVLLITYGLGLSLLRASKLMPMWLPRRTAETQEDAPAAAPDPASTARLWTAFSALALAIALAGYGISQTGSRSPPARSSARPRWGRCSRVSRRRYPSWSPRSPRCAAAP